MIPLKVQHEVFEKQIALAQELNLPISVHNRDAFEDCYAILKNMNIQKMAELCTALMVMPFGLRNFWT